MTRKLGFVQVLPVTLVVAMATIIHEYCTHEALEFSRKELTDHAATLNSAARWMDDVLPVSATDIRQKAQAIIKQHAHDDPEPEPDDQLAEDQGLLEADLEHDCPMCGAGGQYIAKWTKRGRCCLNCGHGFVVAMEGK